MCFIIICMSLGQDTVLALQSLSEFARMAYSDSFNMEIAIRAGHTFHNFTVTKQNALLLQSIEVSTATRGALGTTSGASYTRQYHQPCFTTTQDTDTDNV